MRTVLKGVATLLLACLATTASSQEYPVLCSYSGDTQIRNLEPLGARSKARNVVRDIARILEIYEIPVYRGDVGNAAATIVGQLPAIVYSQEFMNQVNNEFGLWAAMTVFAHEVGHHVNRDLSWYGQFEHSWTKELQADFVSGYVMAKIGAPLEDAQATFLFLLYDPFGSATHPDTARRVAAIEAGWLRGGGANPLGSRFRFLGR